MQGLLQEVLQRLPLQVPLDQAVLVAQTHQMLAVQVVVSLQAAVVQVVLVVEEALEELFG
jgi:hypothetical protein